MLTPLTCLSSYFALVHMHLNKVLYSVKFDLSKVKCTALRISSTTRDENYEVAKILPLWKAHSLASNSLSCEKGHLRRFDSVVPNPENSCQPGRFLQMPLRKGLHSWRTHFQKCSAWTLLFQEPNSHLNSSSSDCQQFGLNPSVREKLEVLLHNVITSHCITDL